MRRLRFDGATSTSSSETPIRSKCRARGRETLLLMNARKNLVTRWAMTSWQIVIKDRKTEIGKDEIIVVTKDRKTEIGQG